MSENSHIDKIFKDGLGERSFSNADSMWQKMEAELDKSGEKKKRPLIFFIVAAALLTAGIFTARYFNETGVTRSAEIKPASPGSTTDKKEAANSQASLLQNENTLAAQNNTSSHSKSVVVPGPTINQGFIESYKNKSVVDAVDEDVNITATGEETIVPALTDQGVVNNTLLEKITFDADLIPAPQWDRTSMISIPPAQKKPAKTTAPAPATAKKDIPKPGSISIEAVGGGDLLRLNRKAGFYAGVRISKHLDNGTSVSVGMNYASHTVLDKYRVTTKPADQRSSDARINSISSVRVPVYLQRQMGTSKFAMMIGLVPAYITQAEVYNVPNSYIGDPNPYRKFTVNDINRFNLLFGAGIKYSPVRGIALELSGSYGLTGMVKDGYKNLSRVNDNFKSIQLGVALQLK